MKKVLIVDDEENIRRLLEIYFNKSGFETYLAKDGRDALQKFDEIKPQLVVLDLMLPFISGEEVAQKIRKKSSVPIIMLTAKAEEDDRIEGLEIGADDYIVKPFSPREVIARAKAVLRRAFPDEKTIKIKDLEIMPKEMKVVQNGKDIFFTLKEFKVLIALAKKAPGIMSRDEIMDQIYDEYDDVVYDRTIDAYVKNIRKKLGDDPKSPKYIDSVYGAGYRMIKDEL